MFLKFKQGSDLNLQEIAGRVAYFMYDCPKRKNLIDAYTHVRNKTGTDYSYEEVKEYLFHHDPTENSESLILTNNEK